LVFPSGYSEFFRVEVIVAPAKGARPLPPFLRHPLPYWLLTAVGWWALVSSLFLFSSSTPVPNSNYLVKSLPVRQPRILRKSRRLYWTIFSQGGDKTCSALVKTHMWREYCAACGYVFVDIQGYDTQNLHGGQIPGASGPEVY